MYDSLGERNRVLLDTPKAEATVTKSLCRVANSLCERDGLCLIVVVMDVVAIVIGIVMFALAAAHARGN